MITKEQLQAMSDFEVNKALCTLIGKDVSGICELRNQMTGAVTDFCNTPNGIMPLAFENGISLIKADNENAWLAMAPAEYKSIFIQSEIMVQHERPLRAIACCLILVLQEKKQ